MRVLIANDNLSIGSVFSINEHHRKSHFKKWWELNIVVDVGLLNFEIHERIILIQDNNTAVQIGGLGSLEFIFMLK